MQSMQLFPLQTVLYPHCVLPLHIFEPRYRTMIHMCLEHGVPFGIVQLAAGVELLDASFADGEPFSVGTVAEIQKATLLEDGRLLINTRGGERFRIAEASYDGDCMTALVEPYRDAEEDLRALARLALEVRSMFQVYWETLEKALNRELGRFDLPEEPDILSWIIPAALQHLSNQWKQALLETRTTRKRLEMELYVLQAEIEKLSGL